MVAHALGNYKILAGLRERAFAPARIVQRIAP
jgi:hypothetical protein